MAQFILDINDHQQTIVEQIAQCEYCQPAQIISTAPLAAQNTSSGSYIDDTDGRFTRPRRRLADEHQTLSHSS